MKYTRKNARKNKMGKGRKGGSFKNKMDEYRRYIKNWWVGGGKPLNLDYYATPVSGLKVAEPTYWINGGKKTRKKRKRV